LDAQGGAGSEAFGFGEGSREIIGRGNLNPPEVRVGVVRLEDSKLTELLFALFLGLALGVGGGEDDGGAVREPREGGDGGFQVCQLEGLTSGGGDEVDLALAITVRGEGRRTGRARFRFRRRCRPSWCG